MSDDARSLTPNDDEHLCRISVMGGPLDGLEEVVAEPPPDILLRESCRADLWDIEATEPPRWIYRCACDRPPTGDPVDQDGAPIAGELVTEMLGYDGGRQVTAYLPPDPPEAVVFAGDGQLISRWGGTLEAAGISSTVIVGVHRTADEEQRLHEYSPGFEPKRFAAHERFFVEDVRRWTRMRLGIAMPAARTAVHGVSAGGELSLALGLRHPGVYGAMFCASPGAGYRPPDGLAGPLPRAYLVAGSLEPFFLANATRWADALQEAGADVVIRERVAGHDSAMWRDELPLMIAWAFGGVAE